MSNVVQQTNSKTEGAAWHLGIVSQVGLLAAIAALVGAALLIAHYETELTRYLFALLRK